MKNNKKWWIIILILLVAVAGAVAFIIHDRNNDAAPEDEIAYDEEDFENEEVIDMDEFDNGIQYDEELEGAEIDFKDSANESDFYGSWAADSGHSKFMYGDLDLTIEEGGKWKGVIVDEEMEGTWTFDGQSVKLSSDFFNASLIFAEDGKLIMQEDRDGSGNPADFINTVLTKK